MIIKGLIEEDFVQYKKPSMVILMPHCDWKCGKGLCHNSPLAQAPTIIVNPTRIALRYLSNMMTRALVFSGLEPMMDLDDLLLMVDAFRRVTSDPIIIYTGYYKEEIPEQLAALREYKNIIVKFGRFEDTGFPHFDETLGVYLASENQYAEKIS